MTKGESYRRILRSSSIIGAAAVLNMLFGVARTKVAAVATRWAIMCTKRDRW